MRRRDRWALTVTALVAAASLPLAVITVLTGRSGLAVALLVVGAFALSAMTRAARRKRAHAARQHARLGARSAPKA